MKRFIRKHGGLLIAFMVLISVVAVAWAATVNKNPYGVAAPRFYGMTYGDTSSLDSYYAAMPSLSANDEFTTNAATQTLTNKTWGDTGTITAANIANVERPIPLPLAEAFIVGTGIMGNDGTTAPGLATTDSITKIVYASSAENASLQWNFKMPADYSAGLAFRLMVSTSDTTSPPKIRWRLMVNRNGVAHATTWYEQTAVQMGATADVSPEVITLTPTATALAAIQAGDVVTVEIANDAYGLNATTEIAHVQAYYTAIQ